MLKPNYFYDPFLSYTTADLNIHEDVVTVPPLGQEDHHPLGETSDQDDGGESDFTDMIHLQPWEDGENEGTAVDPSPGLEESLVQPTPLDHFGLAVNIGLGVLTCTICCTGLVSEEWTGHMLNKHKPAFTNSKKHFPTEFGEVKDILAKFNFGNPVEVRLQKSGQAPVKGIKVHTGFYCPVMVGGSTCRAVMGTMSTFANHLSKAHKNAAGKPDPNQRSFYSCNYQTIFEGKYKQYFMVQAGLTEEPTMGPYEMFIKTYKPTLPYAAQNVEPETRDLPSLLRVTHWDVFVGPFRKSPKDVVSLVNFPSHQGSLSSEEQLLCSLHSVSKAWFKKIYEIWKGSSPSIRRLLGMA